MTIKIWLRAETKLHEQRSALTPETARILLEAGHQVFVEDSPQAAIPMQEFSAVGCTMVAPGSWPQAPDDVFILGLKELPVDASALTHRHIYFAHAYKHQIGWQALLDRFRRGGGALLDIEFLLDEHGRRVAAFGYWAGFAGAAVGVKAWCGQRLAANPVVPSLSSYPGRDALIADLNQNLDRAVGGARNDILVMVIGAAGRVGSGAIELANLLNLPVSAWDLQETAQGGPFTEILRHDIFINCAFVNSPMPPFVTHELLASPERRLGVICDVSCDPFSDYNPLPIYNECTTFHQPARRLIDSDHPLDLVAIDHLPSLLPVEASDNFSRQLLPHLLRLDEADNSVWAGALELFREKIRDL